MTFSSSRPPAVVDAPPITTGEIRRGSGALLGAAFLYSSSPILFLLTGSVFVAPTMAETGLPATAVTIAPFITLALAITQPFLGMLLRRSKPRTFAIIGLAGTLLALAGFVFLPASALSFWGLAALVGIVGSFGYWATLSRFLSEWFKRRYGAALGLVGASASIIAFVLVPVISHSILTWGWRAGYVVLLAYVLIVAAPLVAILFRAPTQRLDVEPAASSQDSEVLEAEQSGLSTSRIVHDARFWTQLVTHLLLAVGTGGFLANLVPLVIGRGFAPEAAATLAMAILCGTLLGRVVGGVLLDRLWSYTVPLLLFPLSGIAAILLVTVPETAPIIVLWLIVILLGMSQGAEGDFIVYFMLREFGPRKLPVIAGVGILLSGVGTFVGGFALAFVRDLTGSYTVVAGFSSIFYFIAAVVMLASGLLSRRAARRGAVFYAGVAAER